MLRAQGKRLGPFDSNDNDNGDKTGNPNHPLFQLQIEFQSLALAFLISFAAFVANFVVSVAEIELDAFISCWHTLWKKSARLGQRGKEVFGVQAAITIFSHLLHDP